MPAQSAIPGSSRRAVAQRAAADPLTDTTRAIVALWRLPCTCEPARRYARFPVARGEAQAAESSESYLWSEHDWAKHVVPRRHLRSLVVWPGSRFLARLVPYLAALVVSDCARASVRRTAVSTQAEPLRSIHSAWFSPSSRGQCWTYFVWHAQLKITGADLSSMATPLGLLLAFHVNLAVGRFHEARALWGVATLYASELAGTLAACPPGAVPAATHARCARLLVAFAWAAKATTRYEAEGVVAPMLDALLPPAEARAARAALKPPLAAVLSMLRRTTQVCSSSLKVIWPGFPQHRTKRLASRRVITSLLPCGARRSRSRSRRPRRLRCSTRSPSCTARSAGWSGPCRRRSRRRTCATRRAGCCCGSRCCRAACSARAARVIFE